MLLFYEVDKIILVIFINDMYKEKGFERNVLIDMSLLKYCRKELSISG